MLGGQVSLWKYDVGTLSETKIRDGIKDKGLDSFFSKYTKPRGHWQGKNRILVGTPRSLYYGSSTVVGYLNAPSSGNYYVTLGYQLWCCGFTSTDSEPSSTEAQSILSRAVSTFPTNRIQQAKRFVTNGITDINVFADSNNRECAVIQQLFLWYPGELVSSALRSVFVAACSTDQDPNVDPGVNISLTLLARWRIKDSGGNPVTLTKQDQEVLLLQYSLLLYSN